jgi:hypothetical protein
MKHMLLTMCLVSVAAVQSSMAAVLHKPQAPAQNSTTTLSSTSLSDFDTRQEAKDGFSAAPIMPPELSSYRSVAEPTLLASNCMTFAITAGGYTRFFTICW